MKRVLSVLIIIIFTVLLLPLAIVWIIGEEADYENIYGNSVSVYIKDAETIKELDINDYLKCVVAAEVPADFEKEAIKAQAVAARTYLYSHIKSYESGNVSPEHIGAVICTDYAHCQAYITEDKYKEKYGERAEDNLRKISECISETADEIMTYNGEVISAVFHSTSSGRTESATDVWGNDIPYLQSVESTEDEQSPKFRSELVISEEEFKNIAENKLDGTNWNSELVSDILRSDAGGIISVKLGGVSVSGNEFRNMYSLHSTNVDIIRENGNVKMNVKGYGHGVGMSQYGANYLAANGKTYKEILKKYYTGIKIEKTDNK